MGPPGESAPGATSQKAGELSVQYRELLYRELLDEAQKPPKHLWLRSEVRNLRAGGLKNRCAEFHLICASRHGNAGFCFVSVVCFLELLLLVL